MNGLTAFILGCIFGAIITSGIITALKRKNAPPAGSTTSGGANKPPATEGKPPINNPT